MRILIGITATLSALTIAGCGDHARRDARVHDDTTASYDALASDRTRDRDADVATATTPPDVSVQQAYDRSRADRRARGELGTAGEASRAKAGVPPPPAGPNASGFGGTSAGGETGSGGTSAGAAAANADGPIPYAGSRTITPPYPMELGGANGAGGARAEDHGGTRSRTVPRPTDPAANQWLGQPPGDSGPNRLDTAPHSGTTGASNR